VPLRASLRLGDNGPLVSPSQRFELFVALRYLRAKRKQAVISVITVISILGVAAGVMALIIALAINAGFRNTLQRTLLGATAHVSVLEKEPDQGISGWRELSRKLSALPHVVSASPGLYSTVLVSGTVQPSNTYIKGIDLTAPGQRQELQKHMKQGSLDALLREDRMPSIVIGSKLARNIGMMQGGILTMIVPRLTPLGPRPTDVRFRVAGIFESGFYELDATWTFTSLKTAQRILDLTDVVNAVELKLDDIHRAVEVARLAEAAAGPKLAATTWMDQNQALLAALNLERTVIVVTIGLIQLVAALNILIALVMMVMEKHRDIALLAAMGAREGQIRRIFMLEGLIIGAAGTAIGLAAGYALCYFADRGRWIRVDEAAYSLSFVPFETRWMDGLWVSAAALTVSFLATLYPARNAARVLPAEALRYE